MGLAVELLLSRAGGEQGGPPVGVATCVCGEGGWLAVCFPTGASGQDSGVGLHEDSRIVSQVLLF